MSDTQVAQFTPVKHGQYLVTSEAINKQVDAGVKAGMPAEALLMVLHGCKTKGVAGMNLGDKAALPIIARDLAKKWAKSSGPALFQAHYKGMVGLFDDYRLTLGLNDSPIQVGRSGENLAVSGQLDAPYAGEWNAIEAEDGEEVSHAAIGAHRPKHSCGCAPAVR